MTQPPEQQPPESPQPPTQPPTPPGGPVPSGQAGQWPVAPPAAPYPAQAPGYGPGPGPGQYYPPGGGYGVGAYPQPNTSSGSGKTIAIVVVSIVVVILLICGGIVGLFAWFVNSIDDYGTDSDREGGISNPITVEVGEAFEIDGVEYAQGWKIVPPADEFDGSEISDLKASNEDEDGGSEYVSLTFDFVTDADTEVGTITCHSAGSIAAGRNELLKCSSSSRLEEPYDRIEVWAS